MYWHNCIGISLKIRLKAIQSVLSLLPLLGITWLSPVSASSQQEAKINQHQASYHLLAQADRNSDRFLQPNPVPSPIPPESDTSTPTKPTVTPSIPSASDSTKVQVQSIKVTDSSVFGDTEFNPIIEPFQGQTVTVADLKKVADDITQLYLSKGYITSRAILVEDSLNSGVIEIRVIEGSVEKIEVEGTKRLNPDYVRSRIRLGATIPLNTANLEDQLRLLKIDPLFENVEASLRSGTGLGQSILVIRVKEANPFGGNFGIDNYSPPSVGSERLGIDLFHRNLTGIGDQFTASFDHTTTDGSDTLDFSYRVPINAKNGTIQVRTSFNDNQITQEPFDVFDISGQSELYEISYRQPLIRNPRQEFALSFGFTFQNGTTFLGGEQFGFAIGTEDGKSRTSVFKFGQEYTTRDVSGAWAFRSQFSLGADIFDATINSNPIPDGRFFAWLGQIQRVQVLNPNNFLIIQADIQLTPDTLLPSQQFVIGGGQSLRGFRQNVRAGDNGFRFSIEDRITVQRNEAGIPTLQLAPFFDMGSVWNADDNPNTLQDQTFLAGLGLGLLWQPIDDLNIRLDYALPLIDLDDRGKNAQEEAFYFNVNYGF